MVQQDIRSRGRQVLVQHPEIVRTFRRGSREQSVKKNVRVIGPHDPENRRAVRNGAAVFSRFSRTRRSVNRTARLWIGCRWYTRTLLLSVARYYNRARTVTLLYRKRR